MADVFVTGISFLYHKAVDSNVTSFQPCQSSINHYKFYQFSLIPAVILTLLMAATTTRKSKLLEILKGRPGLLFPMDSLTRSSRISYGCAFGATAFIVYQISIEHQFAIEYSGHLAVTTLLAIFSMVIYGIVFFPVFACLALGSAFSFGLGAVYVWVFLVVDLYSLSECSFTLSGRAVLFVRKLPTLFCLCYLSITLPIRFGIACRRRNFFRSPVIEKRQRETLQEIKNSYQGQHVRKLLAKPEIVTPPEGLVNKAKAFVMSQVHKWIYHREKGFRYSSRLLAVMFVAACVVYVITVELAAYFYKFFGTIHDDLVPLLDKVGREAKPGENVLISAERKALLFAYYAARTIKYSLMVSIVLACTLSFFTILHMMSSFRNNLYAMYRGDFSFIPPPEDMGAVALCTGSIKFAGYQVAYFVWAYIVTFVIIALISLALATLINLFMFEVTDFIVNKIIPTWPSLVIAIIIMIIQWLLSKFIFLQGTGQHLRLDNRRFFFVFTYFMFFFNIFLGLVSCLLRIIKAIGVGTLFLGRLDNSTLPRKFEFFDPGFAAYQGFIHMEAAHTHPVVNVFIRLLACESRRHRDNSIELKSMRTDCENGSLVTKVQEPGIKVVKPINVAARFNWQVTYTLLHNPTVRIFRRGYVHALRKAREEGRKIPISDRPITTYDLIKTDEDREREKQEELLRIESQLALSSARSSRIFDKDRAAERGVVDETNSNSKRNLLQRQPGVDSDQDDSLTDDTSCPGSVDRSTLTPVETTDVIVNAEQLEHMV